MLCNNSIFKLVGVAFVGENKFWKTADVFFYSISKTQCHYLLQFPSYKQKYNIAYQKTLSAWFCWPGIGKRFVKEFTGSGATTIKRSTMFNQTCTNKHVPSKNAPSNVFDSNMFDQTCSIDYVGSNMFEQTYVIEHVRSNMFHQTRSIKQKNFLHVEN